MNRRNFMRAILGTAAATALPSEVWPFRKIFLPASPSVVGHGQLTLEELDLALRPHDMRLYNFGDGLTVMPVPNFGNAQSYLTSSIFYVTRKKSDGGLYSMGMKIKNPKGEIRLPNSIVRKIVQDFDAKAFEAESVESAKAANLLLRAGILS